MLYMAGRFRVRLGFGTVRAAAAHFEYRLTNDKSETVRLTWPGSV